MKRLFKVTCLVYIVLALQGCATKRDLIKESNWPYDQRTVLTETEDVVLVADTQIHESRGTASRWFSLASDEFIPVTIRSGQQVIGTVDILTEVLKSAEKNQLILHLGDALDVSCETEWTSFMNIMKNQWSLNSRNPMIFVPGNHDGFLVGNFYPFKDDTLYKSYFWDNVCNAGRAFESDALVYTSARKERIIEDYVGLLNPIQNSSEKSKVEEHCIESDNRKLCYSKYINEEAPWQSYIVQLVSLKLTGNQRQKIYGLFLDTSDFDKQPWPLGLKAGVHAGLSIRQLNAARKLINDHLPKDAKYFVAGHHDYTSWKAQSWPSETQALLDEILVGEQSLRFLITAHTHEGGWYSHSLNGRKITELNLGSLIDYPISFRTLKFVEVDNGAIGVFSKPHFIDPENSKYKEACSIFNDYLHSTRSGYSVKDQETENDRLGNYPWPIRVTMSTLNAIGHFFKFWKSKHTELKPQLLTYRDIVEFTMPENGLIYYYPLGTVQSSRTELTKPEILKDLKSLAECDTGKYKCSVQEKAHLLLALDNYYSIVAAPQVQEKAHLMKFCLALNASADAAKGYLTEITKIKSRIAPEEILLLP